MGIFEGITHSEEIEELVNSAQSMYDSATERLEAHKKSTSKSLENLGKLKLEAWSGDMSTFLDRFGAFANVQMKCIDDQNLDFIEHDLSPNQLMVNMRTASVNAGEVLKAGALSIGTGALVGIASYGGVMMFAKASTGTAIATLFGAAKTNATEIERNIYQEQYKDVYDNLTDELHSGAITSGGTTLEEVRAADENPVGYAKAFERKQMLGEMKASATNMAKASFVTTGIVSGVTNMFEVFKNEKDLADAFHDVGADAVKGAVRGGATGVISTAIRYQGLKTGSALLTDGLASTVMAGGLIDGGVALYAYAKGEIGHEELKEALIDTTAKATTTIYFTKAVTAIMGKSVSPIVPLAVYTTASYVFTATREIIKNANLNAEEYNRMAALLDESTRQINEYNQQLHNYLARCEVNQRRIMNEFLTSFNYNMETGENYDEAILAITKFAEQAGITLKYVKFDDFSAAMKNREVFMLE